MPQEDNEMWQPGTPVTEAEAYALLDELYAMLPPIDCKGKCFDSCTSIEVSELERRRISARGVHLPETPIRARQRLHRTVGTHARCPALSSFNTCTVYDVRPFVCRAFGMVSESDVPHEEIFRQAMMCDYGCIPDGVISVAHFVGILDKIEMLSRQVTGVTRRITIRDAMDKLFLPAPTGKRAASKGGKKKCRKRRKS